MDVVRAAVVQFPHPGPEHNAKGITDFPWNPGSHRRKFLRAPGSYLAVDGSLQRGTLDFWGEWESPSTVVHEWKKKFPEPTWLHEPYWRESRPGEVQNTDPWVFGERFRYSNCKQAWSAALRKLPAGSVVLFGSAIGSEFVLDTCFVVGRSIPMQDESGHLDDAFTTCTVRQLDHYDDPFVVHQGATVEDLVEGMFSFVPAQVEQGAPARFRRPAIELPGLVNPKSRQSPGGQGRMLPIARVSAAWQEVLAQIRDAGLVPGVQLDTPPYRGEGRADSLVSRPARVEKVSAKSGGTC
ncbi:MAG: hypothetical protein IT192_07090 [Microbacteriaceae bacterium]|nr:hypothetical protein [Microbacteriaceae bacterium]